jgi:hypothetical protein
VGDVRLEQDSILILQTPFNSGWHAFRMASQFRSRGLRPPRSAGQSRRAQGRTALPQSWLLTGAVITGLSALLLAILLWRKPRLAVSLA